ncbi:MAG: hypothetical protein ACM3N6_13065 [Betaproteobacteria bacterium]
MNIQRLPRPRLALSALLGAVLAACGGGGGGGPEPITVSEAPRIEAASAGSDISLANYQGLAPQLAQLVLTSTGSGYLGARVSAMSAGRGRSQLAETVGPFPCANSGGTLTLTGTDNNGNGQFDAGDTASITYSNCQADVGAPVIDGTFNLSVNRSELDANGDATAVDFDGSMVNLTEGTLATLNGPFRVVRAECDPTGICGHQRVSFRDATATHAGQTVVLRLDVLTVHGGGENTEISGAVGVGGQFYALVPAAGERFVVATGQALPQSGRMRMLDAASDALEIKGATGDLVDFRFFPSGSTAATGSWLGQPWSAFQ